MFSWFNLVELGLNDRLLKLNNNIKELKKDTDLKKEHTALQAKLSAIEQEILARKDQKKLEPKPEISEETDAQKIKLDQAYQKEKEKFCGAREQFKSFWQEFIAEKNIEKMVTDNNSRGEIRALQAVFLGVKPSALAASGSKNNLLADFLLQNELLLNKYGLKMKIGYKTGNRGKLAFVYNEKRVGEIMNDNKKHFVHFGYKSQQDVDVTLNKIFSNEPNSQTHSVIGMLLGYPPDACVDFSSASSRIKVDSGIEGMAYARPNSKNILPSDVEYILKVKQAFILSKMIDVNLGA